MDKKVERIDSRLSAINLDAGYNTPGLDNLGKPDEKSIKAKVLNDRYAPITESELVEEDMKLMVSSPLSGNRTPEKN
jgi:hypothetical protein